MIPAIPGTRLLFRRTGPGCGTKPGLNGSSLPAAHTFRPFLKCSSKAVNARSKQQVAPFRSSGMDDLYWPNLAPPSTCEKLNELFLLREHFRNGEVVFVKDPPNRFLRKQIMGIIDGSKYLLQGAQKDGFILPRTASNPAERFTVFA